MMALLQVITTVGEAEALVAKWKIRYKLTAGRDREPRPVIETGVFDGVARNATLSVRKDKVDQFAPPSLDHPHSCAMRRQPIRDWNPILVSIRYTVQKGCGHRQACANF